MDAFTQNDSTFQAQMVAAKAASEETHHYEKMLLGVMLESLSPDDQMKLTTKQSLERLSEDDRVRLAKEDSLSLLKKVSKISPEAPAKPLILCKSLPDPSKKLCFVLVMDDAPLLAKITSLETELTSYKTELISLRSQLIYLNDRDKRATRTIDHLTSKLRTTKSKLTKAETKAKTNADSIVAAWLNKNAKFLHG